METVKIQQLRSTELTKEASAKIFIQLQESSFFTNTKNFLLLSGGSCIDVAKELIHNLPANISLENTTVALADERWVASGSTESNEQQLRAAGVITMLEEKGATFISMLGIDNNPEKNCQLVEKKYQQLFLESQLVVLLAGIGDDGHTLGILPNQNSEVFFNTFSGKNLVTFYKLNDSQNNPFKERITLTFTAVSKISLLFVYAVGQSKQSALQHFVHTDIPLNAAPALGLYLTENEPTLFTNVSL